MIIVFLKKIPAFTNKVCMNATSMLRPKLKTALAYPQW